jgi:hypothetical protein
MLVLAQLLHLSLSHMLLLLPPLLLLHCRSKTHKVHAAVAVDIIGMLNAGMH